MAEPSLNRVTLLGRLTAKPDARVTSSGTSVANLRMATNESYKDNAGQWADRPEYHTVVLWGRVAEIAERYLNKGSRVYIEGSLQTRSWEDRDNNRRWVTEVRGRKMIMLGGPGDRDSQGREGERYERSRESRDEPRDYARGKSRPTESTASQRPRRGSGYQSARERSADQPSVEPGGASRTDSRQAPSPGPAMPASVEDDDLPF